MKKIKIFFASLLTLALLTGCTNEKQLTKYDMQSTDLGFDTIIMFSAFSEDEATFKRYQSMVEEDFRYYDQLFDKYHTYDTINNIKTINDAAGKHAVKVDQALLDLLLLSKHYDDLSNHQFSITMGSVLNIWHDAREQATAHPDNIKLPSIETLKEANKATGWDHIEIDEKARTVFIKEAKTQLDVGAIAKGYAVEKIAQKLEKAGLEHGLINAGGNVRLIGSKPEGMPWSVGLQIPNIDEYETDSLVSILIDESASFVTSGDYQRYFEYEGQLMHHIIDPETLMPARHCRSVTVITKDSGIADMLSTTLFTMSYDDGVKFIEAIKAELNTPIEAIWVFDDRAPAQTDNVTSIKGYDVAMSDGVKDMLKK